MSKCLRGNKVVTNKRLVAHLPVVFELYSRGCLSLGEVAGDPRSGVAAIPTIIVVYININMYNGNH